MTPPILPFFRGWTVDVRLREFRRVQRSADGLPGPVEFVRFETEQGDALLTAYIRSMTVEELDALLASGYRP